MPTKAIRIVYVPDEAKRGPDLDRIGTIETVDVELARLMVSDGQAEYATNDEIKADEAKREVPAASEPEGTAEPVVTDNTADGPPPAPVEQAPPSGVIRPAKQGLPTAPETPAQ